MILKALTMANQYSNLIIAVTSVLLFIVTAIYALFTRRMVREMQLARIDDLRPYIIIDTVLIGSMFHLIIKNAGRTAARKVSFKIDKNMETIWKNKMHEMPLFKAGIVFFAPGKEFVIDLGPHWLFLGKNNDESKYPKSFAITVEYCYFDNIKATESSLINLEEYFQTRPYPNEVTKAIENAGAAIGAGLSSIAKSSEKLSRLEELSSPTGLDLSQRTLYHLSRILNKDNKEEIKFDMNLASLKDLVLYLGLNIVLAEKILEKRCTQGYFKSYDDLKDVEGMTKEVLDNLKKQAIIYNPNY